MITSYRALLAQLVVSLIADSGIASLILSLFHTLMENDHEIYSTVILLLLLIKEEKLSLKSESMCTEYLLTAKSSLPGKKCG